MKSFSFLIRVFRVPRFIAELLLIASVIYGQSQSFRLERVSRVIDGDTFVLNNGERVRLLGIDTPEFTSKDSVEQYLAYEAFSRTRGMIDGKVVKLTFDGNTKDIFGRTLAYVFILNKQGKDSLFVQAELLKSGLARILMYPKYSSYYHLFYNLRNTARKKHLGAWNK